MKNLAVETAKSQLYSRARAALDARPPIGSGELYEPTTRQVEAVSRTVSSGEIVPLDLAPVMVRRSLLPGGGAQLADMVRDVLTHWARYPATADEILTTLWIVGTWWRTPGNDLAFRVYPLLMMLAEADAGKTRVLEEAQALSYNPSGIESFPTEIAVREICDQDQTLFLDDLQLVLGNGGAMRRLQSYLRAYKMGASSSNARGGGLNSKGIYGPKAVAGLNTILTHTNGLVDDLLTRGLPLIAMEQYPHPEEIPDQDSLWDEVTTGLRTYLAELGSLMSTDGTLWPVHTYSAEGMSSRRLELAKTYYAIADRLVDPRVVEEKGSDPRWALMARKAVQDKAGGTAAQIRDDLLERMQETGITKEAA